MMSRNRYNQTGQRLGQRSGQHPSMYRGNDQQSCTHSVYNNSICRKCGVFHDRVRLSRGRNRFPQRNRPIYNGSSRAREREKKELEEALVDIAVQESLETHEEEMSRSPQKIMRKSIPKTEFVDYERYGSQIGTQYSDISSNVEPEPEPELEPEPSIDYQSMNSGFRRPRHFDPYVPNNDGTIDSRNTGKKRYEETVKIATRRFDDYDTDQSLDINSKDVNSKDVSRDDSTLERINNSFIEMSDRNRDISSQDEENEEEYEDSFRLNVVVGRGRRDLKGGLNFPLNPAIEVCPYLLYVDQNEEPDPDIWTKIEDLRIEEIGLSPDITSVRVYFDWSSFYCTAMQEIVRFMNRVRSVTGMSVTVYAPLYADDKSLPGDVKRCVVDSQENKGDIRLMLVCGTYPLFDWHDMGRITELRKNVNSEMFIMITNHDL
jgi:hypothetical protein